jgi:hypothetical protein
VYEHAQHFLALEISVLRFVTMEDLRVFIPPVTVPGAVKLERSKQVLLPLSLSLSLSSPPFLLHGI